MGESINLEIGFTAYIMYGHVDERYIRLPTSLLYNVGLTADPLTSLLNFVPCATGVSTGFHFSIFNIFKILATFFC